MGLYMITINEVAKGILKENNMSVRLGQAGGGCVLHLCCGQR